MSERFCLSTKIAINPQYAGDDFKARTEHSENRVEPRALDPQLRINREGIPENTVTGSCYPSNVFFAVLLMESARAEQSLVYIGSDRLWR